MKIDKYEVFSCEEFENYGYRSAIIVNTTTEFYDLESAIHFQERYGGQLRRLGDGKHLTPDRSWV
jgi:hypothetical protein